MRTKVSKWGNSLAVRIPAAMAEEAGIACGDSLELEIVGGKIVVAQTRRVPTLQEMLDSITPENIHPAVDWGRPVGKELL